MKAMIVGILIIVCVAVAIKTKDSEIRSSKYLKQLIILATLAGLGFLISGLISLIFGG